jgi:hypothetical protein
MATSMSAFPIGLNYLLTLMLIDTMQDKSACETACAGQGEQLHNTTFWNSLKLIPD